MSAQRALRLVRPLFTQPRRPCSSCNDRGALPPCPPCESAPPPPCRIDKKSPLKGQRVVCCAPPQGQRPPCADPVPDCDKTCEHQIPVPEPLKQPPVNLCGAARDTVSQRIRDFEEFHRKRFEREAAERKMRRAAPVLKDTHSHKASTYAIATDGQAYAVIKDAPAPRCCAAPTSTHCSTPHPPPTPITLEPLGDCRPKQRPIMDPCQNQPRTILTIDRSANEKQETKEVEATKTESPKPVHENPKSDNAADKVSHNATPCEKKGLTTRIMETLKGTSKRPPPTPAPPPTWCNKPPKLAPPPPKCRPPTMADRIRRQSPTPKRHFHTSTFDFSPKSATKSAGRDEVLAASKKLSAALSERESLKEAGQGRTVRAPSCAPKVVPPPPPPRPSGGAMEFNIPPGADTVCVRVSMGKANVAPPGTARPPSAPAPARSSCPPHPCIPRPPLSSSSDSWLSIKKLQKKISGCGRGEVPAPAPARPAPPEPCPSQGKAKMTDVLPHTIFIR